MSNRKGGRYDSGGNWWAREPSLFRRIANIVAYYVLLAAFSAGLLALTYAMISYRDGGDYRDGYDGPVRSDQFHNR